MLEVDAGGLDRSDRALLDTVATKFGGGPVGLSTLAVAIAEEAGHDRGRARALPPPAGPPEADSRAGACSPQRAYEHLGLPAPEGAAKPVLSRVPADSQ